VAGKKADTGMREVFAVNDEKGALEGFELRKANATKAGWTLKVRPVAQPREKKDRDAFKEIPPAPKQAEHKKLRRAS
jgi:hypothetical protein